jgi:hypothetical protein
MIISRLVGATIASLPTSADFLLVTELTQKNLGTANLHVPTIPQTNKLMSLTNR